MTLGPAMLCLAWFDGLRWKPANPLIVFGRVPLFYFVVHFYAAHAVAVVMAGIRYGRSRFCSALCPTWEARENCFPPISDLTCGWSTPFGY